MEDLLQKVFQKIEKKDLLPISESDLKKFSNCKQYILRSLQSQFLTPDKTTCNFRFILDLLYGRKELIPLSRLSDGFDLKDFPKWKELSTNKLLEQVKQFP